MSRAVVNLWGRQIGAVLWDEDRDVGVFEYTPEFSSSGIEVAPLTMPLRRGVYDFPALNHDTFKGLPGMLADSLPDKFGNALINRWLAEQGRTTDSFDPVERLCYTGRRGMGALEFEPSTGERRDRPNCCCRALEALSTSLNAVPTLSFVPTPLTVSELRPWL